MRTLYTSKGPDFFMMSLFKQCSGRYLLRIRADNQTMLFLFDKMGRRWSLWNKKEQEVLTADTAASLIDTLVNADYGYLNTLNTQGR